MPSACSNASSFQSSFAINFSATQSNVLVILQVILALALRMFRNRGRLIQLVGGRLILVQRTAILLGFLVLTGDALLTVSKDALGIAGGLSRRFHHFDPGISTGTIVQCSSLRLVNPASRP